MASVRVGCRAWLDVVKRFGGAWPTWCCVRGSCAPAAIGQQWSVRVAGATQGIGLCTPGWRAAASSRGGGDWRSCSPRKRRFGPRGRALLACGRSRSTSTRNDPWMSWLTIERSPSSRARSTWCGVTMCSSKLIPTSPPSGSSHLCSVRTRVRWSCLCPRSGAPGRSSTGFPTRYRPVIAGSTATTSARDSYSVGSSHVRSTAGCRWKSAGCMGSRTSLSSFVSRCEPGWRRLGGLTGLRPLCCVGGVLRRLPSGAGCPLVPRARRAGMGPSTVAFSLIPCLGRRIRARQDDRATALCSTMGIMRGVPDASPGRGTTTQGGPVVGSDPA
jgi:hypothetical protein